MSRGRLSLLTRGLPRGPSTGRWLLGQVGLAGLLGLLLTVLVGLVLATARLGVPVGQMWPLITAGLLVTWLLSTVEEPPRLPPASPEPADLGPGDEPFPQPARWERRLSISDRDPQWYTRVVRDRIVAIAAERLRRRHGIRLRDDPVRARAVLGEPLYGFLTDPVTDTPDPRELYRLVTRMEEI